MPLNCRVPFTWLISFIALASAFASDTPLTEWLDVPFVQQVKAGCGSAAISMVVQYWARQLPGLDMAAADTERINQLLPASPKGIQGKALQEYLRKRSFAAFIFDGELRDLKHHLEEGRPIVVCLAPKGGHAPLHYAVVVGLDDKAVWLNDSMRGKLFHEDVNHFLAEWKETGNWALLAVPESPGRSTEPDNGSSHSSQPQ